VEGGAIGIHCDLSAGVCVCIYIYIMLGCVGRWAVRAPLCVCVFVYVCVCVCVCCL
jgi:hypothetical protein